MATKSDLMDWVLEALGNLGGHGSVVAVSREIWQVHESDLRHSGDLFFTWQYDVRWAAQKLRDSGRLKPAVKGASSGWALI
tara:strand:+ start:289 stop:531 length:243 start_codon:yes stop_codon:yes gene_type:complete